MGFEVAKALQGVKEWAPNIGSLFGTILSYRTDKKNRQAQIEQNEKDRNWQQAMYEQQRRDALADFQMQNAYNSPEEQMNRLRQAGLNPNLIYGKGADNTAQSIRSSTVPTGNQPAPQQNPAIISNGLAQMYQLKNIQANTDNLSQNVALSKEEALVKQATVAKMVQETATNKFQLDQATQLKDMVIRQAHLNNVKTETDIKAVETGTQLAVNKDEREQLSNAVNIEKTVQDIYESKLRQAKIALENETVPMQREKIQAEIKQLETITSNAKIEGQIKALDLKLREKGIMPSDPIYFRFLTQFLTTQRMEDIDKGFEQWYESVKDAISE